MSDGTTPSSLRDRIIEVLRQRGPLNGKEIARLLGEDSTTVNRVLYGSLRSLVQQGSDYRWSLLSVVSPGVPAMASNPLLALQPEIQRLSRYFLECLSEGGDEGVSVFASSFHGILDYHELPAMPLAPQPPMDEDTEIRRFLARGRSGNQPLAFRLGLPVLVVERRGKNGQPYRKVEPLLLWPLGRGQSWYGSPEGVPSLNPAAIKSLTGSVGPEELQSLTRELGLEEPDGQGPDLDELLMRLQDLQPDWPWMEELDLASKGPGPPLNEYRDKGILNRTVLVAVEESRYTTGLREELGRLAQVAPTGDSCLGRWMLKTLDGAAPPDGSGSSEASPVLPILPLNQEQEAAVERGLREPLTVLTGPPGTGKSQVVTALLINAAHQGQRVLFASKNHQAVDVVEARVNGLSEAPVLLRLGARGEKNRLVGDYLGRLLASSPGTQDKCRFEDARGKLDELHRKLADLADQADRLVEARNTVDELEQQAEGARTEFGEERFRRFAELDPERLAAMLRPLYRAARAADRGSQSWVVALLWPLLRSRRLGALEAMLLPLRGDADVQVLLNLLLPAGAPGDDTGAGLLQALQPMEERLDLAGKARKYLEALSDLQSGHKLEDLYAEELVLRERLTCAAHAYWDAFMAVRPSSIDSKARRVLSEYASVLALLAQEREGGGTDRKLWAKYYKLSQEAVNVLSCWAVTSLSARGRVPFSEAMFDLLVIDEASQCDIASALPLLFRSKRAVIIGDPQQLRHISSLSVGRDRALQERAGLGLEWVSWSYSARSLYDLAQAMTGPQDILMLCDHHRSHPDIIEFSNREFYEGRLRVATRLDRLQPHGDGGPRARWVHVAGKSVRPPDGGLHNMEEAHAVVEELRRLVQRQNYRGSIGVVSPFRDQANRIRDLVAADGNLQRELDLRDFACDTVHRFQGDERDLIIFSPTVSEGPIGPALAFLGNQPYLFNVAITRARACLVVVGNRQVAGRVADQVKYLGRFAQYLDGLHSLDSHLNDDMGPDYPRVSNPHEVSDWERLLYRALYRAGLPTIPQYPAEKYLLDLALIRGDRRLAIEVDGERYHRAWDGDILRRDQLRNSRLLELGWDIKRFWVYQVRDDLDGCVRQVREWADTQGQGPFGPGRNPP